MSRTITILTSIMMLGVMLVQSTCSKAQPGPSAKTALNKNVPPSQVFFKTANVAGIKLFYREAGDSLKPTIILLHGFPSSSYQYHDLIPRLAVWFHVIAPDYPGMGYSEAPSPTILQPVFDAVAMAIDSFIAQCAPGKIILYIHDIGSPIGMRFAANHPEKIAGLVFQNTTVSLNGWRSASLKFYDQIDGPETPEKLTEARNRFTMDRSKFLHQSGAHQPEALNPDNWAIDSYAFSIEADRLFMSRLFIFLKVNWNINWKVKHR